MPGQLYKAILIFSLLLIPFGLSVQPASGSNGCPITINEPADIMTLAYNDQITFSTFSVDPRNKALITINNNTNCQFPVSLGAYRVYDQLPSTQELHDSHKTIVNAQSSGTLLVDLPSCMSQIDLYHDPDQDGPPTPPTYANPKLIGWTFQLNEKDNKAENDIFHFDDGHPYEELDRFPGDDDDGFSNVPEQNRCSNEPALQVQCSVSPNPADTGQQVKWSSDVSGGDGEYSYIWTGDATGNSSEVTETYSSTGEKTAEVLVTSGNQQRSAQCDMDVESDGGGGNDLSVSCAVDPDKADTGESVEWSVDSVSGGSGNYSFGWNGDVSKDGETVYKDYDTTGEKQATVTVTDEITGATDESSQCSMDVESDGGGSNEVDVTCSVTPDETGTGNEVVWAVDSVSGGDGSYTFSWSGDANGNTDSVSEFYSTTGTKEATVTATDSSGNDDESTCDMNIAANGGGGGDFTLDITNPFTWLVSNSTLRSTMAEIDINEIGSLNKPVTLTANSVSVIDNTDTKFVHNGGAPQETLTLQPDEFSDPVAVYVRDQINAATYPLTVFAEAQNVSTKTKPLTLRVRSIMEF